MNWTHKDITIEIDTTGKFIFECCNNKYRVESLDKAKEIIDDRTKDYYKVDDKFIDTLLRKLTNKEAHFIKQLIQELRCHKDNPYCELGIYNYLDFIISDKGFTYIEKIIKKDK